MRRFYVRTEVSGYEVLDLVAAVLTSLREHPRTDGCDVDMSCERRTVLCSIFKVLVGRLQALRSSMKKSREEFLCSP